MKIGIIGGGLTGLSAAYDLSKAGHTVTIFEAGSQTGGLATGFQDESWAWPLEKFYHHIFESDSEILNLAAEIGVEDEVFFPRPTTSVIFKQEVVPFDSPMRWITFPGFNMVDVARYGFVSAYLRFTKPWRQLEKVTADAWLQKFYGQKIHKMIWQPILIGKFGPYYKDVNMAWMWARLHVRSMKLGYFIGGFQAFVQALTTVVQQQGVAIHLNCPAADITPLDNLQVAVAVDGDSHHFDAVLVTTSPQLMSRLAPDLPPKYLSQLLNLKSMGAVVLTLALKRPLLPKNTYWLNIPATTPDKTKNDIPFLALVEHTNFIDKKYYGGDHLVYCGDYVLPDHEYMTLPKGELQARFTASLSKITPQFTEEWIRKSWLFRAKYAQPVPFINHSSHIPSLKTPLPNLYFASMSQVYPWDRGTNFAVQIGRKAAKLMQNDLESTNVS